jgi:UDP-N-acetyl-D-mannosaminuronate dehydrogenase
LAHQEFLKLDLTTLLNKNRIIYDAKGILSAQVDGEL